MGRKNTVIMFLKVYSLVPAAFDTSISVIRIELLIKMGKFYS